MALSDAERARAYRERKKCARPVRYRRPADRRSKPERWRDAVLALRDLSRDSQPGQRMGHALMARVFDGCLNAGARPLAKQAESA